MPQNWDIRRIETPGNQCPECGGAAQGGRAGCQALFDEITYAMGTTPRIAAIHALALDTYSMQHVESYCRSAKSYLFHLVGLCRGIEYPISASVYAPVLNAITKRELVKPPVLSNRGSITLPDVMAAYHAKNDVDELVHQIWNWANHVWTTYASQHEIARSWLK